MPIRVWNLNGLKKCHKRFSNKKDFSRCSDVSRKDSFLIEQGLQRGITDKAAKSVICS